MPVTVNARIAQSGTTYSCCMSAKRPELLTLSLHDALPISTPTARSRSVRPARKTIALSRPLRSLRPRPGDGLPRGRSEEHTSELQSRGHVVCRLLDEKTKKVQSQLLPLERKSTVETAVPVY